MFNFPTLNDGRVSPAHSLTRQLIVTFLIIGMALIGCSPSLGVPPPCLMLHTEARIRANVWMITSTTAKISKKLTIAERHKIAGGFMLLARWAWPPSLRVPAWRRRP